MVNSKALAAKCKILRLSGGKTVAYIAIGGSVVTIVGKKV